MRNPLSFIFADPSQHGSNGDTMGRPARNAREADRQGWANSDRTDGFSRGVESGGRRRLFGRKGS
ncbi:hypothetical protein OG352_39785 (plasmid) [Streptomyces sp. NBC_01485]|uniref:hypothetical protein n=1 Tax=Streptomyces sp. NBC_01485 TaxID=2903884 RepID=UPI002E30EDAF|nr:hypothetical protein [Streptomyces sp. NBC_01485]